MKQLAKILGISGLILCLGGLGIFAVGYAYGGSDYIGTTDYENFKKALHLAEEATQEQTPESEVSSGNMKSAKKNTADAKTYKMKNKELGTFSSIAADLDYIDLIIKPSKNQSAYLSYELHCKNNKKPFTYKIKDGCLHLNESNFIEAWAAVNNSSKLSTSINQWKFTVQNYINTVTLYVPSGTTYKNSNIVMNEGDLAVNGLRCKKTSLKLEDGDATVKKLSCGNITVTTTDGDLIISDLNVTGTATVKTADGDITLTGVKVPGTLQLDTEDGDINAGLKVSGTLKIDTEDGDITVPSLSVSGTARINVLDGDINAPNPGISGSLQINTEDGDLNISNLHTYASGTVKINTEYGDINASQLNISGNTQFRSIGGDMLLQISRQCLNRLAINADVTDGNISVNKTLHGSKKRRGDGWYYTKKATGSKASLKVHTGDGDISIRSGQ